MTPESPRQEEAVTSAEEGVRSRFEVLLVGEERAVECPGGQVT